MGGSSSMFQQLQPTSAASSCQTVELPTNVDSGSEFCTRMQFKVTPAYSSRLQARLRWQQVVKSAQQSKGGSWQANFSPADLTPDKVGRLINLIDTTFLNGTFKSACGPTVQVREQLTSSGAPGLRAVEVCNAVAGFEPETNTIAVFRSGWRQQPSLQCPVQADGVYCLSKLEWLAHTLAHEMVHCIVHNCCPESRQYAAYTHDNGHGPIFVRLNRCLFGHNRVQYRTGWCRLDARLAVQRQSGSNSSKKKKKKRRNSGGVDGSSRTGSSSDSSAAHHRRG